MLILLFLKYHEKRQMAQILIGAKENYIMYILIK